MKPKFPGAVLMTFLVKWAWKTGKLPSEVQDSYDKSPADYYLLMAYEMYEGEREKELIEEEKRKAAANTRR